MTQRPKLDFDAWLQQARPRLLRLAQSRVRDRAEAEDVVQETVLAVWTRHEAGFIEDLDAYANRSVWRNAIRRKLRWRDWDTLEHAERYLAFSLECEADAVFEADALEAAIAQLPAAQALALRLRFYTGLSFRQMAEALSIGLNTAASRTRHALESLRRGLTDVSATSDQTTSAHKGVPGGQRRTTKGRGKLKPRQRRG
jgi:RNA polymerase sigma-70 factor (ECF subfamily)